MTVSHVEEHAKGKITVFLDCGSSFTVYRREIRHLILTQGAELDEGQYQEIRNGILVPRAKKYAMHLLEKMDCTEAQLREKLRQNLYQEDVIEEAIAYVKKFHYVDDLRYACNYVRYRSQSKSRWQLTMELYRKGVPREYVEQALLEEYMEDGESAKISQWIEKKHYDSGQADVKQKQKMYQFLLRKGFRSEDILRLL